MKLYEISDQYQQAISRALDNEADADALTRDLEIITDTFAVKAEAVVGYLRNIEADATAYRAEADRLAAEGKAIQAKADKLKDYLAYEMRRCNLTEIQAGVNKLKFVKNPWSVEVDCDINQLSPEFKRIKEEPDRVALKKALEAGEEINNVRLIQTERLRIS